MKVFCQNVFTTENKKYYITILFSKQDLGKSPQATKTLNPRTGSNP